MATLWRLWAYEIECIFMCIFWIANHLIVTLHKKWSFPLKSLSVNAIQSAGNWGLEEWGLNKGPFYITSLLKLIKNQLWWTCGFLIFRRCAKRQSKLIQIIFISSRNLSLFSRYSNFVFLPILLFPLSAIALGVHRT